MKKKVNVFLMAAVMVLLLAGCGKQKVDLSEYVNVTYNGLNSKGTAAVDIDFDAMENFLIDEKADDKDNLQRLLELGSSISCELDKAEDLSNGDKVVVSIKWDDEIAEKYNLAFSGKTKEFEVTGLEEGKVIDLFQDISLEYSEISPNAKVTVCNTSKDSFVSGIRFTVEKSSGIANGDEIKVTASVSATDAEKEGYIIEETEKVFIAEGIDEYATEYAQIDAETLEKIKAQSTDLIDAALADEYYYRQRMYPGDASIGHQIGTPEILDVTLTNTYFLCLKEGIESNWGTIFNHAYFVYTVSTKDELSPEGKTSYLVFKLDNFIERNTGKTDVVVTDMRYQTAYDVYDNLYRDIVTANKGEYTCEEITY